MFSLHTLTHSYIIIFLMYPVNSIDTYVLALLAPEQTARRAELTESDLP